MIPTQSVSTGSKPIKVEKTSLFLETLQRMLKSPGAKVGTALLLLIILACLFAPLIAPYGPNDMDLSNMFSGPSSAHWLGTDATGARPTDSPVVRRTLLPGVGCFGILIWGIFRRYHRQYRRLFWWKNRNADHAPDGHLVFNSRDAVVHPGLGCPGYGIFKYSFGTIDRWSTRSYPLYSRPDIKGAFQGIPGSCGIHQLLQVQHYVSPPAAQRRPTCTGQCDHGYRYGHHDGRCTELHRFGCPTTYS